MKTHKFCPHCGRPLLRSLIKGYAFSCDACDEDFYRFEVLTKKHIQTVRQLRKATIQWERKNEYTPRSIYKPYPRLITNK